MRLSRRSIYGAEQVHVLTAQQAVDWDRSAREQEGVPERVLMESAGRALASVLHAAMPRGSILAVVGSGHNGADALVAARTLQQWGRKVRWVAAAPRIPKLDVLHGHQLERAPDHALQQEILRADILIDGLLGTGTQGAARDPMTAVIRGMNASQRRIVAVDLPSGVNATTGQVEGEAVRAHLTVTFGAAKLGLMLHPARAHCGRLMVAEIGFPPLRTAPAGELITPAWAWRRRPRRIPTAHKGIAGRLLLVAGSKGMAGAAVIAAHAALRAGVGLLRIVSVPENREVIQRSVTEATFFDADEDPPTAGLRGVVIGCGLGTTLEARELLDRTIAKTPGVPLILDADALNLLAETPDDLPVLSRSRPVLLTPHVRELARLSGSSESMILQDAVGCANRFAAVSGATVLLKGQPSVVASAQHPLLLTTSGSSDLATAGMGDQLAGAVGAFTAAGAPLRDAAGLALFFGGRAADLADRGVSLSPDDVSDLLPNALRNPGRRMPPFGFGFIQFDQPPRR